METRKESLSMIGSILKQLRRWKPDGSSGKTGLLDKYLEPHTKGLSVEAMNEVAARHMEGISKRTVSESKHPS